MAIYEALPSLGLTSPSATRLCSLNIKFVKVAAQAFDIQKPDENEKSVIAEQRRISHMFIPFVTSPNPDTSFSGVFFTGDKPSWILATNKSGAQIYPSGHAVVHSFTACSLWESKGDFLVYSDEVGVLFISVLVWTD
jgi:cleavage and polyadenylation specificity factor subunit 1